MKKKKDFDSWLLKNVSLKDYGKWHERLNGLTHLFGSVLTLVSIIYIIWHQINTPSKFFIPVMIYALCMLVLYCSSTIYHFIKNPVKKRFFRMMDHTNIYLLIAGTYTPIMVAPGQKVFIYLLIVIWILAILGILSTFLLWEKFKILHVLSYLVLGWFIVLVIHPLYSNDLLRAVLPWCIAGGIVYSVGVLLYAIRKIPFHHAIWHLFVFLGSAFFLIGIMIYILPVAA